MEINVAHINITLSQREASIIAAVLENLYDDPYGRAMEDLEEVEIDDIVRFTTLFKETLRSFAFGK